MRRSSALSLTAALAFGAIVPAQAATAASAHAGTAKDLDRAALREAIAVRPDDGAAGIVADVHKNGQRWRGTSGDINTGKPISPDAHFRIGSISKPMEAVILLQLSAEGRVDLDQSVQHYLPGLLPESRFEEPISVRQLLNHTGGLPQDFEGSPATPADEEIERRFEYLSFDEVIEQTLRPVGRPAPGPRFRPGTRQEYNSFGYRVAGKLIEEITKHPYQYEVTARILKPLKMRETRAAVPGRSTPVPAPYLPGYMARSNGELVDVNVQGGLPASMTSTTGDLDRFISGLFDGRLLRPAQAAELFAVPKGTDGKPLPYANGSNCNTGPSKGTACFSVGLMSVPLPDGSVLWGKTGSDPGYRSGVFASQDLNRRAVYAIGTSSSLDNGAGTVVAQRLALAAFGN
ncbi:serine hydrolase domain-containing protein [Streptomyces avidinii]|uniref:D-alanyl-D-alanine carboxypeptidase n=1 Tax=Streptomyces avidinii TaxID=1895 RepID=A0ABS4KWN0_STRAV|nr:serine hydrolase domain-containing protein [Streptomyces avidinii]MBP2034424.1 D-alanyl-D-alanine carboxypeptidase [Streptomyces avidinii]GGY86179.1 peptidase [Streptomyces avidinii]